MTSEVLGSQRCDCKEQLDLALQRIQEIGGAVIYLQQEGRGIGLANKVAAYRLQDSGLDTVDANRELGFADDLRSYECISFILDDIEFDSIKLLTNNPRKMRLLRANGVTVEAIVPLHVPPTKWNERYLRTKARRMAHALPIRMQSAPSELENALDDLHAEN
uniref:GTP cyclohydrolase II n=2 Tax=Octactis speculum TaxID=3111310 RepID=A0A7S2DQ16_9STRA|mmetsp:Transcript_51493/g.70152  ORF Transcript_51493/g.70152 Transcript_51493/m.70152 type:complete len:162 (+) Transcript_51493:309-794(+)